MNIKPELILQTINGALRNRLLYPVGHPSVAAIEKKTFNILSLYMERRKKIYFAIMHDTMIFDEVPILNAASICSDLINRLEEHSIEAVTFEKGFTEAELGGMIDILQTEKKLDASTIEKLVKAKRLRKININAIDKAERCSLEIYDNAIKALKNVMGDVRLGKIPKIDEIEEVVTELVDTVLTDPNAIIGLTMIKDYDDDLYTHCVNVGLISMSMAQAMNLDEEDLKRVGLGAVLHDIGKVAVAESIIKKPGGLDSGEWEKLKAHPVMGSDIVQRMAEIDPGVVNIVYEHHMKFDHSGYPKTEDRSNPLSQIVTIADAYDAITTLRVYQRPHLPVEAVKIMMSYAGKHFDPEVLGVFVKLIGHFPIGTVVELVNGEVGVITAASKPGAESPAIKVILNTAGESIYPPRDETLDTSNQSSFRVVTPEDPLYKKVNLNRFFEDQARKDGKDKS